MSAGHPRTLRPKSSPATLWREGVGVGPPAHTSEAERMPETAVLRTLTVLLAKPLENSEVPQVNGSLVQTMVATLSHSFCRVVQTLSHPFCRFRRCQVVQSLVVTPLLLVVQTLSHPFCWWSRLCHTPSAGGPDAVTPSAGLFPRWSSCCHSPSAGWSKQLDTYCRRVHCLQLLPRSAKVLGGRRPLRPAAQRSCCQPQGLCMFSTVLPTHLMYTGRMVMWR